MALLRVSKSGLEASRAVATFLPSSGGFVAMFSGPLVHWSMTPQRRSQPQKIFDSVSLIKSWKQDLCFRALSTEDTNEPVCLCLVLMQIPEQNEATASDPQASLPKEQTPDPKSWGPEISGACVSRLLNIRRPGYFLDCQSLTSKTVQTPVVETVLPHGSQPSLCTRQPKGRFYLVIFFHSFLYDWHDSR